MTLWCSCAQEAADGAWDYRGVLHRDGTVFSAVTADQLKPQADVSAHAVVEGGQACGWKQWFCQQGCTSYRMESTTAI